MTCAYCGTAAALTQPGRFCSPNHRVYFHRDALRARRAHLADEADAALRAGDPALLEQVARRTVALLAQTIS
ncbi:hypothetical protein [Microbacterium gorillae]|uniref:hypothetical protein n=1 Tax=Microbacterium gorillae TaxID=1231063 RepID=UPI00058BBCC2|nr:hypothetical protein [Microbacterium gorillae]